MHLHHVCTILLVGMKPSILIGRFFLAAALSGAAWPVFAKSPTLPMAPKKWTIMVYLNGKSNLEENHFHRLNSLESAGSDAGMNIVAEYSRMRGQDEDFTGDSDWTGSRRYYITLDSDPNALKSPVLEQTDMVDSGDWRRVANFIKWAKKNFPAERYLLLYRFHGMGWIDPEKPKGKAMNFDDETGNFTATAEISQILKEAGGVDLYLQDVCMMQSLEVLYEIKDYAKIAIGAETLSYGFNYYLLASAISASPAISNTELAKSVLSTYRGDYGRSGFNYQLSAVNTSALGDMAVQVRRWTAAVMRVNDRAAALEAKKNVTRFTNTQYADLKLFAGIFLKNLHADLPGAQELAAETRSLLSVLDNRLVLDNITVGEKMSGLGGVSVYVPDGNNDLWAISQHAALNFGKDSGWTDFARYLKDIN